MNSRSRTYPDRPIIAVGGLLFNGEAALLVKRAKDPGRGRWSIPGGAVKVGESLKAAAVREVAEETGLTVEAGPLVEIVERVFNDQEGRVQYHYIILDYLCLICGSALPPPVRTQPRRGLWPRTSGRPMNWPASP